MRRLTPEELLEIAQSKGSPLNMMKKYNITKAYVYRLRRKLVDKTPEPTVK